MRFLLITLIPLLVACANTPSANVYNISCENHSEEDKKNYLSFCYISISAKNLVRQKTFHCYGDMQLTMVRPDTSTFEYNYGFLQSYDFGKERNFKKESYFITLIYFPDDWQVTRVENKWVKCEKQ